MSTEMTASIQQSCIHCGDCARACPESLDPEALFFALVEDDWPEVSGKRLEACAECNRCAEACPSRIPLLAWLQWGKSELRERGRADTLRARFLARNARLLRGQTERAASRRETRPDESAMLPARSISRGEVQAAIARGRSKRLRSSPATRPPDTASEKPASKP